MSRAADVGKASCRDDGGHPDAAITEGETGARAKNSKQNEVTFVIEIEALKWGKGGGCRQAAHAGGGDCRGGGGAQAAAAAASGVKP
jgi:hypothetical protein